MSRSDLVEVDVQLHFQTEKAWLVSTTGNDDDAVWVAKSQAELRRQGKTHVLECPEWLAVEKKLL